MGIGVKTVEYGAYEQTIYRIRKRFFVGKHTGDLYDVISDIKESNKDNFIWKNVLLKGIKEVYCKFDNIANLNQQHKDVLLIHSASLGLLDLARLLIENSSDITYRGSEGLIQAHMNNHTQVFEYLKSKGAHIESDRYSCLWCAVERGDINRVRCLIENGVDFHSGGERALNIAATYGHISIINLLIEKGANIHAGNECAFRRAAEWGHIGLVKMFISMGVDVHTVNDYALKAAITHKYKEIEELINNS